MAPRRQNSTALQRRTRALSVSTSLNLYQTRQSSNLAGGTSNLTRA